MTPTEIQTAISESPALQQLQADGNWVGLASALPDNVTVEPTPGGIGLIMRALGPAVGAGVLDALEALSAADSAVKWAFVLINRGELDFGDPATRAVIVQLSAQGAFDQVASSNSTTVEGIESGLLGIAERSEPHAWRYVQQAVEA